MNIINVEGINTNFIFHESKKIKQKPIYNKEDMKPRYLNYFNSYLYN